MNRGIRTLGVAATLFSSLVQWADLQATESGPYVLSKEVALGQPDRWDYLTLDAPAHRLYVSHGDRVSVLDSVSGAKVGEVTGFPGGTHGIAISAKAGKGYTDDGEAGSIGVFDLETFKVLTTVPGRPDADGMVLDVSSGHIFVANGESKDVSVIDPATNRNLKNIDGDGKLEFLVADGHGKVFVNGEEKEELVRIDSRSNAVDAHWKLTDCRSPHGLALDEANRRLFVGCTNSMMVVVSADDGHEVAHLPIGKGSDAIAFDANRKRVLSSNGRDGTISVYVEVDRDHFKPLGDVRTGVTARTMTLDPESGRLYVAVGEPEPQSGAPNGRPRLKSGSLRVLFLDPSP